MKQFSYVIKDELGIHARPAGLLVKIASAYSCKTEIEKNGKAGDCKKLFSILGLAVKHGETVKITCDGADESSAAEALEKFFNEKL